MAGGAKWQRWVLAADPQVRSEGSELDSDVSYVTLSAGFSVAAARPWAGGHWSNLNSAAASTGSHATTAVMAEAVSNGPGTRTARA